MSFHFDGYPFKRLRKAFQSRPRAGARVAGSRGNPLVKGTHQPPNHLRYFPRSTEGPSRLPSSGVSLEEDFQSAQTRVKQLAQTPPPDRLLELYSLYKQATEGDVKGSRPGMLDFKGRAKYDAWAARRGTDKPAAMQSYVELVKRLEAQG
jgi:diazepam-binding inhibitor (GABA receptor modulator, acyl-CoA-binding protein)